MPEVRWATTGEDNSVSTGADTAQMVRLTSAALELLEGLGSGEVAGRAGGGDAGVGRVLEVHVGADAGEVHAMACGSAIE